MESKFTAIDLFSGIGGFRIAIEKCGGRTIAFSEINSDAINTYVQNFSESENANLGDITTLRDLPSHDLLTAGVPCQSWSIAGRNLGFHDDRGQLWNDALYLLKKSRPKAFIFENVKGLADPRNKDALNYILARIKEAGYFAEYYVLDSFNYGVPQSRVRIYIVGFCDKQFLKSFKLPQEASGEVALGEIIDDEVMHTPSAVKKGDSDLLLEGFCVSSSGVTSLSSNNNGYNDYFLFNDIRNGNTTIHSWDIIETTDRQKEICLLLLRNRRKKEYGPLDGNPLSLSQFQMLDKTILENELEELVSLDILKREKYSFRIIKEPEGTLTDNERLVLNKHSNHIIVPDNIVCDRDVKVGRVNVTDTLNELEGRNFVKCCEVRYEFRHTKISTGLFGINRIFLPSSNIFPTLVASDSNDFITPVSIAANNAEDYKRDFMNHVLKKKLYRKISKTEALRVQGFPEGFLLPESRSRWMKLIGNSVAVPVVEKLVQEIINTGVFDNYEHSFVQTNVNAEKYGTREQCNADAIESVAILPSHQFKQMSLFEIGN